MRTSRATIAPMLLRVAVGTALVAALAACGDSGEDETPTEPTTTASEPAGSDDASDGTSDGPSEVPTADASDEASQDPTDNAGSPDIDDVPTADVGDCIQLIDVISAGGISELPTVDCAEEHDAQVFALIELPDGDYPGAAELTTTAPAACEPEFEGFIGVPPAASSLEFDGIAPSAESWAVGDREIVCLVFKEDLSSIDGSLEGSGL